MQTIFKRLIRFLLVSLSPLLLVCFSPARADIYQWEYIDPADPARGKQQSTTLAPDGAGVDAVPSADLSSLDPTKAYLIGADVPGASFDRSRLTDADFTGADVSGASFNAGVCIVSLGCVVAGTGISPEQLYSTASYQTHDLRDISLLLNNLPGANFDYQDLTNANFRRANLTGATFRGANLGNVMFGSLTGFDCIGGTCFPHYEYATLVGADFSGANVRDASFAAMDLTGANFRHANLTNVVFTEGCGLFTGPCSPPSANLTNADLTAADARGAIFYDFGPLADAVTTNLIRPDGSTQFVDLNSGDLLVVRDYDGNPIYGYAPLPIMVYQHLTMGTGGTLRMVFEEDAWDSTISFAPGIPVTLDGTLELTFAADVDPASQLGRTFNLFDWTGVTPTGDFTIATPYRWDLSNLYTTGEVTLTAIAEPSSLGLLLLAGAALGVVIIRSRRCPFELLHQAPCQLLAPGENS